MCDSCTPGTFSRRQTLGMAAVAGAGLALAGGGIAAAQQPSPNLIRLTTDAWVFTSGGYNALFIVTEQGVIATDPISLNPQTAINYRAAIASVTDQPVKYVVYSHDHADHNTGGAVFADTAQFVAHRLAAPKIAARRDPRSPVPTILIDSYGQVTLAGKTLELFYFGPNHSDNSLVMRYAGRGIVMSVDTVNVNRLPFRTLTDSDVDGWKRSLLAIDNLEFDILVPGHGPLGTRGWVRANYNYFVELEQAIRDARAAGLADNSAAMTTFAKDRLRARYGTWDNFETWVGENIEGVLNDWKLIQT